MTTIVIWVLYSFASNTDRPAVKMEQFLTERACIVVRNEMNQRHSRGNPGYVYVECQRMEVAR